MSAKTPPDFVIVGAAKSGTTSVYEYLGEHPSVFMTRPKETNFFSFLANGGSNRHRYTWGDVVWDHAAEIATPEAYRALFAAASAGQMRGEASPSYMLYPQVPELLHAWNPDARIVMILRNPAERAWSDFLHNLRDGTEPQPLENFLDAFADGSRRVAEGWRLHSVYDIKGCYGTQLAQWLAVFPADQVGVFFYDDFRADPQAFMRAIFTFIGVDPGFQPNVSQHYNVNGTPRHRALHRFIYQPNKIKAWLRWLLPRDWRRRLRFRLMQRNLDAPALLPAAAREHLARHYLTEVEKLESLTGRDLSAWKPGAQR